MFRKNSVNITISCFVLFSIVLSVISAAPVGLINAYAESVQFLDDFSSGQDNSWAEKSGTWSVENQEYSQSANTSFYQNSTITGSIFSTCSTFEADLKIIDNRGD